MLVELAMAAPRPEPRMGSLRTLFIRGLTAQVSELGLRQKFEAVGPVLRSFTVKPKSGGAHRGYGFVEFRKAGDARKAVDELNGCSVDGKALKVNKHDAHN